MRDESGPPGAALQALRSPDLSAPLTGVERLKRLLALERQDVWSLAWYSGSIGLLSLAVPIAAQQLVNTVAFTALGQPVLALSILVLLGLGLAALLRILRLQTTERLEQRLFVRATHDAVTRLTRARLDAFAEHDAPELMNRFFDVVTVQKASSTLLVDGLSVILQGSASLLLLAFYHPYLLAFDVVLIGSILFVLFVLGRGGVETAVKESKVKYKTAAWLEDVASSFRAFKPEPARAMAFQRADALAASYVEARGKHFNVLLRQSIGSLVVQMFATAGLLGLGGFLVLKGELTLGQLVAAELIVTSVTYGLTGVGKYLESFYDLVASLDKLGAIVDLEEERAGALRVPPDGAGLRFDGVDLVHPNGSKVLSSVTFEVAPGDPLAILGGDVSGKSTLAELVFALSFPTEGRVVVDGIDTRDHELAQLREKVALVGRAELFDGTMLDNLLVGLRAEDVDLKGVLEASALAEEVSSLPQGIGTPLGHAGSRLTSSQAARLMVARALARTPRVLVLDDALDGLGLPTIDRMLSGLRRYPDLALVVLTSREAVAQRVGRIARLDDGRLELLSQVTK